VANVLVETLWGWVSMIGAMILALALFSFVMEVIRNASRGGL